MNNVLRFSTIPVAFTQLEASLFYWLDIDNGIGPIQDWNENRLSKFINHLYTLTHQCLAMQNRSDTPPVQPFITDLDDWLSRPELIKLTRQLVTCCNRELVNSFRPLSPADEESISTLEQINHTLIGNYYFQHPSMDTADRLYFKGKS